MNCDGNCDTNWLKFSLVGEDMLKFRNLIKLYNTEDTNNTATDKSCSTCEFSINCNTITYNCGIGVSLVNNSIESINENCCDEHTYKANS